MEALIIQQMEAAGSRNQHSNDHVTSMLQVENRRKVRAAALSSPMAHTSQTGFREVFRQCVCVF